MVGQQYQIVDGRDPSLVSRDYGCVDVVAWIREAWRSKSTRRCRREEQSWEDTLGGGKSSVVVVVVVVEVEKWWKRWTDDMMSFAAGQLTAGEADKSGQVLLAVVLEWSLYPRDWLYVCNQRGGSREEDYGAKPFPFSLSSG